MTRKRLIKDIFTSTGVLITPEVREMQLEFHEWRRKKQAVEKALAPARREYGKLREVYPGFHSHLSKYRDQILSANVELTRIDNAMSSMTRAVEAIHVYQRNGINLRPDVATVSSPSLITPSLVNRRISPHTTALQKP